MEPAADDMPLDDYLALLDDRYTGLQNTARLYGKMLESVDGNGAKGRLIQHWKKYTEAASTIHRVKYELAAYGKLPGGYEYSLVEEDYEIEHRYESALDV